MKCHLIVSKVIILVLSVVKMARTQFTDSTMPWMRAIAFYSYSGGSVSTPMATMFLLSSVT